MWEKIKGWFSWFMKTADLNKDNKVTAEDFELARGIAENNFKEANEKINEVTKEVTDVVATAKETINQVGDVVAAVKGKEFNKVAEEVKEVIASVNRVKEEVTDVVAIAKRKESKGRKKK